MKTKIPVTHSKNGPVEYKVVTLRECPIPRNAAVCDRPERALAYWRTHIDSSPYFNPDCECLIVLILNSRLRIKGHQLVSIGTLTMIIAHPREIFRGAIIASAYSIVLMHNHPSGDPSPSAEDISVTREIAKAGDLLKIEVFDHVIVGGETYSSLREIGCLRI